MSYRGGYDGYSGGRGRISLPRMGSTVRVLIFVTVAAFVAQFLLLEFRVVNLARYFGVSAHAVVERLWVWQIVTYMFLHSMDIFHVLINMLMLYWFGTELEAMLGRRRFLALYFGGGIAGGLAYCFTQYLQEDRIAAIGASAAVMAVIVVYAIHFPRRIILLFFVIPMQVKWFAVMIVGIDLFYSMRTQPGGVAHTAHLGGALFGFLYWRYGRVVARLFDRLEDRHRERETKRRSRDEKRLDDLLAKISREGPASLTRRERKFLERQSKRRREGGYGR